jgi:hypothetical protein
VCSVVARNNESHHSPETAEFPSPQLLSAGFKSNLFAWTTNASKAKAKEDLLSFEAKAFITSVCVLHEHALQHVLNTRCNCPSDVSPMDKMSSAQLHKTSAASSICLCGQLHKTSAASSVCLCVVHAHNRVSHLATPFFPLHSVLYIIRLCCSIIHGGCCHP